MNYFLLVEFEFYCSGNKYIFQEGEFCFWCAFNNWQRGCIKIEKAHRLKCQSNMDKNIVGNYIKEKYK